MSHDSFNTRIKWFILMVVVTLSLLLSVHNAFAWPEEGRARISPSIITLEPGEACDFKVFLLPKRLQIAEVPSEVVWLINGKPGGNKSTGRIDKNGIYQAPIKMPSTGEIHIQARVPEASNPFLSATVLVKGGNYQYKKFGSWSTDEILKSGLKESRSMCIDGKGNILVAAMQQSKVLQFSKDGTFLGDFGRDEAGKAVPHENMTFVAVDGAGRVFMGDRMTGPPRVSVFDEDGKWLFGFAPKGVYPWMVAEPAGMAFHPNGKMYLADMDAMRVAIFDNDGKYERILRENYPEGNQFNAPSDIAMDAAGDLFVASQYGPCEKVNAKTGERILAFAWPSPPVGLMYIDDIYIDQWGDVFMAVRCNADPLDSGTDFGGVAKVLKYNNNGDFLTEITLSVDNPSRAAVAVDEDGAVYVAYSQGQGKEQTAGVEVFKH